MLSRNKIIELTITVEFLKELIESSIAANDYSPDLTQLASPHHSENNNNPSQPDKDFTSVRRGTKPRCQGQIIQTTICHKGSRSWGRKTNLQVPF